MNRHTIAGLASVLIGGPVNLVSALERWLHRLPTDPALIVTLTEKGRDVAGKDRSNPALG